MSAHSPKNLQNHLYASFLEGNTADVALHISGSWQAVYKLHRVVLIQAVSSNRLIPITALNLHTLPTGILPTSLYGRLLGITFPPGTVTLRWS